MKSEFSCKVNYRSTDIDIVIMVKASASQLADLNSFPLMSHANDLKMALTHSCWGLAVVKMLRIKSCQNYKVIDMVITLAAHQTL